MLFPFLVILPGLIAIALPTQKLARLAGGNTTIQAQAEGRGLIPAKMNASGQPIRDKDGAVELDYDLATPNMLLHYFPTGILGLGLTALLASFMSGMAGNVTAFNTVWTYDIYQSYINKKASDEHYLWMGRMATIFGIALSVATAYMATRFNNIMDMLQLVFAFVNAPLFATFLLGMFWKRTTGHGAFTGLLGGTTAAALHHALTLPQGGIPGVKGGWIGHHARVSQRNGTEFLDCNLCLDHLLHDHDRGQPLDPRARREGTGRPGVLAHRTPDAARPQLVSDDPWCWRWLSWRPLLY